MLTNLDVTTPALGEDFSGAFAVWCAANSRILHWGNCGVAGTLADGPIFAERNMMGMPEGMRSMKCRRRLTRDDQICCAISNRPSAYADIAYDFVMFCRLLVRTGVK